MIGRKQLALPLAALAAASALAAAPARACTNILVARGATPDGSTLVTYAADSHELYGELYHTPAATHPAGAMRDVHEWDTGDYLGQIRQAAVTYNVVGNMNEHQVAIGETTFGGREELVDPKGGIDYGSLMYVALERARTAREAIDVMTGLVAEYGYRSEGESFSISDPKEVWILEMVGKGPGRKGAVWVARRVPDGHVSAHANQARIRQFPRNDPRTRCTRRTSSRSPARRAGSAARTRSSASPTPTRPSPRAPCAPARRGCGASSGAWRRRSASQWTT